MRLAPSPRGGSHQFVNAWVAFALFFSALLVFSRSFGSELVFDSRVIIGDDLRLREWNAENIGRIFTENYWWPSMRSNLYRPVATLSFAFEYAILGFRDKPIGYQLVNLLLHWSAAYLVFRLFARLGLSLWPAFLIACWFLLHPFTTEVVPNIVGRSDALALIAMLTAMLVYLQVIAGRESPARGLIWIALAGVGGMLSKESAASLLGLIGWHALTLGREQIAARWKEGFLRMQHVVGFMGVVFVLATALVLPKLIFRELNLDMDVIGADNPLRLLGWWDGRLNALAIMGQNMVGCVLPLDVSADYSYAQVPFAFWPWAGAEWQVAAWALGTLIFGVLGLGTWKRLPALSFSIAATFILLLPTSNLLVNIGTVRADRLVYPAIPAMAFTVAYIGFIAWRRLPGLQASMRERLARLAGAGFVAALFVLGLFTHLRGAEWRNAEQFWASTYATAPKSFKAMAGHAIMLSRKGDIEASDEAVRLSTEALDLISSASDLGMGKSGRLIHSHAVIHLERGKVLRDAGRLEEAAADFRKAEGYFAPLVEDLARASEDLTLRTQPAGSGSVASSLDMMAPTLLLSELLRQRGASEEAVRLLERYLDYNRLLPAYLQALGRSLVEAGDWERGLDFLLESALLKPFEKQFSGEAAWVWTQRTLPPTAAPLLSDKMAVGLPALPLINLNDPELDRRAQSAARRISQVLSDKGLLLERHLLVRQIRYKVGQPSWLPAE